MRRNIFCGLLMMMMFGGVLGCGKEDPAPVKGVNPLEERSKSMSTSKEKSPMMPKGGKPGGK